MVQFPELLHAWMSACRQAAVGTSTAGAVADVGQEVALRVLSQDPVLLDLADLQSMLAHIGENAGELTTRYGNVTRQSVGIIQRQLLSLDAQGGAQFFGEPALDFAARDDQ